MLAFVLSLLLLYGATMDHITGDLSHEAHTVRVPQTSEMRVPWELGLPFEWSTFSAEVMKHCFVVS